MTDAAPLGSSPPAVDEHTVFRAIFGAYPDALLLVDSAGRIVLANPAASQLFGYPQDELAAMGVDALVPDSIRPRHAQYRHAYARNPHPRPMGTQMDLVAKRRDGSEVMVEIALSPLLVNAVPFVVTAVRGIGAYPRVKQALQRARYSEYVAQMGRLAVDMRDSQDLLQQVVAVAAEALQVKTAMLYLLEPHPSALRLTAGVGLLASEGLGSRMPSSSDTPQGFMLRAGGPVVIPDYAQEMRFAVPASQRDAGWVSGMGVPLSDRGRAVGVLSVQSQQPQRFGDDEQHFLESLSNLLAATLQRVQSEESLHHSQRLESVGQLTGGIAHDFNNLLTVIQGNLQALEELPMIAADPQVQQMVTAAMRASRRGAELTGKLLAFSRRQVLSPSRVDVPALLHSLADMLRRTVDQRIRITVDAPPDCPPCRADSGQLESALLNIAINARDAMASGGELRFSCHLAGALPDDWQADAAEVSAEAYVVIAIADSGDGMSDTVKERAFEPFFTTKDPGRGTGLGLSTVYGFVKQSHGAIGLDSAPGSGTTVTLHLPVHSSASPLQGDPTAEGGALPPGLRVLLVEDEPEVRAVAQRFLAALSCRVTEFASAEQALQALSEGLDFDLLFSDVALGTGLRGTDLAREVRLARPGVAVLLVSGYSAELLDIHQSAPASWELLAKPYRREELQAAMVQALAVRLTAP